jgi:hypothetical protein
MKFDEGFSKIIIIKRMYQFAPQMAYNAQKISPYMYDYCFIPTESFTPCIYYIHHPAENMYTFNFQNDCKF